VTPSDLRAARKRLGLTQKGLAKALRMGTHGWQSISKWERDTNERGIPGPVQVAVELLLAASPKAIKEGLVSELKAKATMTLNLTEREMDVLSELAKEMDMSKTAIMRQALRWYQTTHLRLKAGEKVIFSGDEQRMIEFVGPLGGGSSV
jgi:DNA-binding XRE family transcriptional regulator